MRAGGSKWDQRIERANALAAVHPAAAEGLRFYERIAVFQRSLYADLEAALGSGQEARPPGSLREELDLGLLLPAFPGFLALVEAAAPAPLSPCTAELRAGRAARWQDVLVELSRTGAHRRALAAVHRDGGSDEARQGGPGGGRAGGNPAQPVGRRARLREAADEPAGDLTPSAAHCGRGSPPPGPLWAMPCSPPAPACSGPPVPIPYNPALTLDPHQGAIRETRWQISTSM